MRTHAGARRDRTSCPRRCSLQNQGGAVKTARWLGVGAGLLIALAALLAVQAFVIYEEIMAVASLVGYLTYLLTNLALLVIIGWRRLDRAYFWAGASMTVAAAGGGAAHLAGRLGWGRPLLFTLISACGYAACAVCFSVGVATLNRSGRRDRQA